MNVPFRWERQSQTLGSLRFWGCPMQYVGAIECLLAGVGILLIICLP